MLKAALFSSNWKLKYKILRSITYQSKTVKTELVHQRFIWLTLNLNFITIKGVLKMLKTLEGMKVWKDKFQPSGRKQKCLCYRKPQKLDSHLKKKHIKLRKRLHRFVQKMLQSVFLTVNIKHFTGSRGGKKSRFNGLIPSKENGYFFLHQVLMTLLL